MTEDGHLDRVIEADTEILVRNDCCQEDGKKLAFADMPSEISFDLQPLPAKVIATCDVAGDVSVTINNKHASLNETVTEPFDKNTTQTTMQFDVRFAGVNVSSKSQTVSVRMGETKTVVCEPL
jgi:hypothetical protein